MEHNSIMHHIGVIMSRSSTIVPCRHPVAVTITNTRVVVAVQYFRVLSTQSSAGRVASQRSNYGQRLSECHCTTTHCVRALLQQLDACSRDNDRGTRHCNTYDALWGNAPSSLCILEWAVHHCQLSWCLKQSFHILESLPGAAGELCVSSLEALYWLRFDYLALLQITFYHGIFNGLKLVHPNLKFKMEISYVSIQFLDLIVSKDFSFLWAGLLSTRIYFINGRSCIARHILKGIAVGEIVWTIRNTSCRWYYWMIKKILVKKFYQCGFSKNDILAWKRIACGIREPYLEPST